MEVNVAFAHKVRALKHLAHWPYRQISAPTGVALSTGYRIAHTPVTPPYKNMRGWYSILRTPHQERLICLATASSQNRQKPYLEIARMAGLTACDRTLHRTMSSASYYRQVARKKLFLSNKTRLVCIPPPDSSLFKYLRLRNSTA